MVSGPTSNPRRNPLSLPHPAVAGLTLTPDGVLHVPAQLKRFVDVRNEWVNVVGTEIEKKEREAPGTFYGLPKETVYAALNLPPEPNQKKLEKR